MTMIDKDKMAKPEVATAEVRQVTPEQAALWLTANTSNRFMRKRRVELLAHDMAAGTFTLTPDAIAFNRDGTLINGQHRLAAVVKAGVAVPLIVAYGLPDEAYDATDDGLKRSLGDSLRRRGVLSANQVAAVVNLTSRNGRDGVNMRVFDVAGCGGVLCSNDTPGLRSAFVLGEEAIGFAAVDELPDRCRRLLGDPQHADRLRRAARERTLRDHTWDSRWRDVFGWLAERDRSHTAERRAA